MILRMVLGFMMLDVTVLKQKKKKNWYESTQKWHRYRPAND